MIIIFLTASCGIGKEPNIDDKWTCSPCEIGFYSDCLGADMCFQCPIGHLTSQDGSDKNTDCIGNCVLYLEIH